MKVVKAAAVQISPVLYSRDGTVEKVVRKIHELGEHGVQFATFPETGVPYYPYFAFIQTPYQLITGREHLKLLEQASRYPLLPSTQSATLAGKGESLSRSALMNGIRELCTTRSFSSMPTAPCFSGDARSRPPTTSA